MSTRSSRRQFLRRSATSLVLAGAAPAVFARSWAGDAAPNELIRMGCIGMGGHGVNRNLKMLLKQKDARVDAVCDVFDSRTASSKKLVHSKYRDTNCDGYRDFRRVLDRKDIDAVMISTPDHWHVLMSVLAMRAGKDVICEKPTLTIEQGQILTREVKRLKKVFQTSTEDRSLRCYHHMAQVIRNGLIGDVKKVEVRLPAGQKFAAESEVPIPSGFDYDLWLGPAPKAPYTPSRTERQHWRHVWDYSGGKFSDWGMHQMDTVQWALDQERSGPVSVKGQGSVNEGSIYNTFIDYELDYRYANGTEVHIKSGGTSLRFHGTKAWIGNKSFNAAVESSDPELVKWRAGDSDTKLRTNFAGEHRDFLDCVRSRKEPYFPAEVGHRCASLMHMGNISMRLERPLTWDPKKEEFVGDAAANAMRSVPMREPWSLA